MLHQVKELVNHADVWGYVLTQPEGSQRRDPAPHLSTVLDAVRQVNRGQHRVTVCTPQVDILFLRQQGLEATVLLRPGSPLRHWPQQPIANPPETSEQPRDDKLDRARHERAVDAVIEELGPVGEYAVARALEHLGLEIISSASLEAFIAHLDVSDTTAQRVRAALTPRGA
jgi:hypothetical protein